MRAPVLDIPDDPAQLAGWLEEQLIGMDLGLLVAELAAVHGQQDEQAPSLAEVLGQHHEQVLREGLAALERAQLQTLLKRPGLLLELQEELLLHGGRYWEAKLGQAPFDETLLAAGWQRLRTATANDAGSIPTKAIGTPALPWYARPLPVGLATAAVVLLAVWLVEQFTAAPPSPAVAGWGWDKPGALPQDVPPDVYLNRLAEAAEEWFNKRPETRQALARRILEFRQGCSTLILTEHEPLPPEDQAWLVERCQAWAEKLDTHLGALEAGQDVADVRAAADETVRKLIDALRQRADSVG